MTYKFTMLILLTACAQSGYGNERQREDLEAILSQLDGNGIQVICREGSISADVRIKTAYKSDIGMTIRNFGFVILEKKEDEEYLITGTANLIDSKVNDKQRLSFNLNSDTASRKPHLTFFYRGNALVGNYHGILYPYHGAPCTYSPISDLSEGIPNGR